MTTRLAVDLTPEQRDTRSEHDIHALEPDEILRQNVLNRARELDLPVKADNVHIVRSTEGLRIDVRYFVRVTLPGYTVDMHFYPGAGSR